MNENKNEFYKGVFIGIGIATIIYTILWMLVILKIDNVHKQEIDYFIEKHQTK